MGIVVTLTAANTDAASLQRQGLVRVIERLSAYGTPTVQLPSVLTAYYNGTIWLLPVRCYLWR
jgi:hypothetical protein